MYNAAINGQKLAPDVRKGFVNRSDILYKKAKTDYEKREQTYRNLAKAYGLDPERTAPSRALYDVKENKKSVESKKSVERKPSKKSELEMLRKEQSSYGDGITTGGF